MQSRDHFFQNLQKSMIKGICSLLKVSGIDRLEIKIFRQLISPLRKIKEKMLQF